MSTSLLTQGAAGRAGDHSHHYVCPTTPVNCSVELSADLRFTTDAMNSRSVTAVISGYGMTEMSHNSGRTVLDQAAEACQQAIDNAGLQATEVDGMSSFSLYHDSVPCSAVAATLGLGDLNYLMDADIGGQAAAHMVLTAAAIVEAGVADHVVVFRALNGRSGVRIGREPDTGGSTAFRYAAGLLSYPQVIATWAQRYMIETGADEQDLGAAVVAQRQYAMRNPRAVRRKPLNLEDYLSQPFITTPFRAADCAIEIDGAAALVVSNRAKVSSSTHPMVAMRAGVWLSHQADLDLGGSYLATDYSRSFASHAAPTLWERAGMAPSDIDIAELYDCFSGLLLMNLEGFGFCGRGEAGAFIRSGETGLRGSLPTNTHGGLLSEGYLHGMNTVVEAVRQLQQRAGDLQVDEPTTALVCSGGRVAGSAVVLERLS